MKLYKMELLQNNFVINLENRIDRLKHVQEEFKRLNILMNRFNAIKMRDGAVGCTLSHMKCIELAIERDYEYAFVCEDDITFLNVDVFKQSLTKFKENMKSWDVLLIGGNVVKPFENIDNYCLKVSNIQTTTGYVVNKHYYSKLLANFKAGLKNLLVSQHRQLYAIDMYWKKLQVVDEWYFLYPLTVTQYENYSDIEERSTNYNHLMLDPEKKWLYADKNT